MIAHKLRARPARSTSSRSSIGIEQRAIVVVVVLVADAKYRAD